MGEEVAGGGLASIPAQFRHVGPADVAVLRPVRRAFFAWLQSIHDHRSSGPTNSVHDAALAFSELFTNALEAGASMVEFVADCDHRGLTMRLCDDGPDWVPPPEPPAMPEAYAARGRGLALLARLGTLRVERAGSRTEVSLELAFGEVTPQRSLR